MPPTTHSRDIAHKTVSHDAGTLEPSLEAAKELARVLATIPEDSPAQRHPNYAVTRAMTMTVIDMLEEMARDAERRAHGNGHHHHHGHGHRNNR
jgi:hypothetical protein